MKYTVQIVGVGGQGVLMASMVLGNAAMEMGFQVVHGMAQRGGSVLSTLRFGDEVISPLEAVGNADMIMGFEPSETCRNIQLANRDSVILMNMDPVLPSMVAAGFEEYPDVSDLVDSVRAVNGHLVTIDATSLAIKAGKAVAANAVMIGAVAALEGFPIPRDVLKDVLGKLVPEKFRELNLKAFDMGYEAARN